MNPAHRAVAAFFFMQGLCASTWAARIPAIAHALALSDIALGGLLVAAPMAALACMPIAGLTVARFGSHGVLRACAPLQAAGVLAIGAARTPCTLMVALAVYGAANTLVQISVNAQAVASERPGTGSWMATYHGMWSAGGFAGAALAAAMVAAGAPALSHFAAMGVLVAGLYACTVRHLLEPNPRSAQAAPKAPWAWPRRALVTLGLLAFAAMFCETSMFDWSGIYLRRAVGVSPHVGGVSYAAMMGTMAIGRFAADALVNRVGLRTTLRLGAGLTVAGLGLAVLWPTPACAISGFMVVGLGLASLVPLMMGVVGRTPDMAASMALAWASTIGFAGAMAAPPTLGWLAATVGLRGAFAAVMGMACIFALGLYTVALDSPAHLNAQRRPARRTQPQHRSHPDANDPQITAY